jgi:hypothetical protein
MMEEKEQNEIGKLRKQGSEYFDLKLRILQLEMYEKASLLGASLISSMIVIVLVLFFITSLFLAFAFYLGQTLHNYALGFLISGGIYLLVLILFLFLFRKPMKTFIINKTIQLFTQNDEQE